MTKSSDKSTDSDIWDGDLLERKDEGRNLLYFLEKRYERKGNEAGFVLAVNGQWGAGKSFFVEKVSREAIKSKHPTLFFNAWENDFTKDPLLAFISEFNAALSTYFNKVSFKPAAHRKVQKLLKECWKPALKIVGFALAKQVAGLSAEHVASLLSIETGAVGESSDDDDSKEGNILKDVTGDISKLLNDALKEHQTIKDSIELFKTKVTELIKTLDNLQEIQLPILIFVDELDRCRPDYAIELLEGIKHLFGVCGLYFVVATNIEQLSHSVKAIYGSEFDGKTYLKRFFDLQYSLPEPSTKQFCYAIASKMACPDISSMVYGLQYSITATTGPVVEHDSTSVVAYVLELHASAFELSLRDQLQVSIIVEAVLLSLDRRPVHIFFLVFLAVIYHKDLGVYSKMVQAKHLDNGSGFPGMNPKNGKGVISFRSNSYGSEIANLSVEAVAHSYFNAMSLNERQWEGSFSKINPAVDFPRNMIFSNCIDRFKTYQEGKDFESYTELVRRAGGFSTLVS